MATGELHVITRQGIYMKGIGNKLRRTRPDRRASSALRSDSGGAQSIRWVRGLDALEFLERSRELAAEAVIASPVRLPTR
jgi:hypothetical protein